MFADSFYDFKQAPRALYGSSVDPSLYFKMVQGMTLILVLYVENILLTDNEPLINKERGI